MSATSRNTPQRHARANQDQLKLSDIGWSPDGAEVVLKLRAVVVNGDLDDYMNYYKERCRSEHHLARYDEDTIERLNLAA